VNIVNLLILFDYQTSFKQMRKQININFRDFSALSYTVVLALKVPR
jgi:hypothetical protein